MRLTFDSFDTSVTFVKVNTRHFFSFFVLVSLLLGVFSAPEIFAHEKHDGIEAVQSLKASSAHEHNNSNCDDEGQACHRCHLGHCAFTLPPLSIELLFTENQVTYQSYQRYLPIAHLENLYRPPII